MNSSGLENPKPTSTGKRFGVGVLFVLILIVAYFFWLMLFSGDFYSSHASNENDRQAIVRIHRDVSLGDGYEQVLKKFWSQGGEGSRLQIYVQSPEQWYVQMNSEVFATDWRLYVSFRNGKVFNSTVRTTDGAKPSEAPNDLVNLNE